MRTGRSRRAFPAGRSPPAAVIERIASYILDPLGQGQALQRGLSAKSAGLHLRYRARIAPLPLPGNRIIGTQPVDKLAFLAPEIRIAGERLVRHAQLLGRPVANILRLLYDQLAHDGALIVGCENQNLALRIGYCRRIVRRRDEDSPVALIHGDLVSAVRNALDGRPALRQASARNELRPFLLPRRQSPSPSPFPYPIFRTAGRTSPGSAAI